MGKHLAPRCPECNKQLLLALCARGSVVKTMFFVVGYCPMCGRAYKSWMSSEGIWNFDSPSESMIRSLADEAGVRFALPRDLFCDYDPE